jgi:phage-related protein
MPIVEKLLPAFTKIGTWISNNVPLVVTLGAVIGTLAAAVFVINGALAAWAAVGAVTAAINAVMATSFSALWVATGAIVILAVIAALIALQMKFDIFGKAIDGIKAGFLIWWGVVKIVFDAVKTGFGELANLGKAIFDGMGGAFKGVINAVLSAMEKGINFAIKGLNTILDGIDKAAGPWVNFGSIPEVKLPRLAEGGIVTGPTIAMIGEAGPEAVIPLNRAGGMGMGANITINVNGGDPNAVVAALRTYMFRNGPLPITVA